MDWWFYGVQGINYVMSLVNQIKPKFHAEIRNIYIIVLLDSNQELSEVIIYKLKYPLLKLLFFIHQISEVYSNLFQLYILFITVLLNFFLYYNLTLSFYSCKNFIVLNRFFFLSQYFSQIFTPILARALCITACALMSCKHT